MTASPLPEQVYQALSRPELAALWHQARKQLERNDAEPCGSVTIRIPDQRTASEVGALLGRTLTRNVGGTTKVDLAALDQRLRNGAAQRGLADTIVSITGNPLLQRQSDLAEKAARRAAQGDEARRLAAELAPYPAAGPLVAILSAQRGGPYRDHAIEAARVILADGTLPGMGEDTPWVTVRWLKRGKKTDYAMSPEPIDEGGQGAVFRAVHKLTDVTIALKRLRFSDDDSVHRMGREIDMGQQYGDHPNVMPVLDADPDGRWFIMPHANGSAADHADRLRETAALRGLVEAACEGLRRPHADGWTHRDLKPANILLLQGRWVVADWGLGRRPRGQTSLPRRTRTGSGFGSEGFAAPELSSGNPHNVKAAADIYSIGRLIAAILTGESPEQNLPLLPESGPWRPIVAEATHHKPADRPQDVDEFLRLLKDIQ
jgi:hypothetical protein